jgi:DNA-directed RNA polymerase subunit K/omega
MAFKQLSRGPSIDIEKCVQLSGGNRFDLVIMAAVRCRELARQHRKDEDSSQLDAPITALLEFQAGKIGREYFRKVI